MKQTFIEDEEYSKIIDAIHKATAYPKKEQEGFWIKMLEKGSVINIQIGCHINHSEKRKPEASDE